MRSLFRLTKTLAGALLVAVVLAGTAPGRAADEKPAAPSEAVMIAAAEKGDPQAMFALGEAYFFNKFNREDEAKETKALYWYRRAAERGHVEAMFRVAQAYGYGWGVQADGKLALEWALKAANTGSANAMYMLAEAYQETEYKEQQPGALLQAVKPDDELAVAWFKKAANAGAAEAFRRVAEAYRSGKGVPKIPAKALEWLQRGAEIEDPMTQGTIMNEIAEILMKGDGVPKDEKAAIGWLEKAVAMGGYYGQSARLDLAEAYQNGTGVKRDFAKAKELLNQITDDQLNRAKQQALQKVTAAEQTAAKARALPARVGNSTPASWAERHLKAPKGYEMLEPSDVILAFWGNRFKGGSDPTSGELAAGSSLEEAKHISAVVIDAHQLPNFEALKGSDQLGRISLGWVAYVTLTDKGVFDANATGMYRDNKACGFVYGAVSKEEALTEAFRAAITEFRKLTSLPIHWFSVTVGVSAKPDWDRYKAKQTVAGPYNLLVFGSGACTDIEHMKDYGSPPETAEEFPAFFERFKKRSYELSPLNPLAHAQLLARFPYWDGHTPLTVNCPEPMMPEPIFEIVEEPAAKP